jgi:hypothetical protein
MNSSGVEERGEPVAAEAVELLGRCFEHRGRGDGEEHEQQRGRAGAAGPESRGERCRAHRR